MTTEKQKKLMVTKAVRMIKRDNLTIAQAAERLDMNTGTLGLWMKNQGVRLRDDLIQRNEAIVKDCKSGIPRKDVAEKYGLSSAQVYLILSGKKSNRAAVNMEFEMTFVDIGQVLGLHETTVYKSYRSAIKKLKVLVVEYDINLEDVIHKSDRWRME